MSISAMDAVSQSNNNVGLSTARRDDLNQEFLCADMLDGWLKTRSDSFANLDFEGEHKPSEIDVNEFLNIRTTNYQEKCTDVVTIVSISNDINGSLTDDITHQASSTFETIQQTNDDYKDEMGSVSRRSSFLKRLDTLMQADKGLFEELLLTEAATKQDADKRDCQHETIVMDTQEIFDNFLVPTCESTEDDSKQEHSSPENPDSSMTNSSIEISGSKSPQCELIVPQGLTFAKAHPMILLDTHDKVSIAMTASQPDVVENVSVKFENTDAKPVSEVTIDVTEDFNFEEYSETTEINCSSVNECTEIKMDEKLMHILDIDDPINSLPKDSLDVNNDGCAKILAQHERSISPGTFLVKLESEGLNQTYPVPRILHKLSKPTQLRTTIPIGNILSIMSVNSAFSGPSLSTFNSAVSVPCQTSTLLVCPTSAKALPSCSVSRRLAKKNEATGDDSISTVEQSVKKSGKSSVTLHVNCKAKQTTITIVSSTNVQTIFKIDCCDLPKAVGCIDKSQLENMGLLPSQLLAFATTAQRLVLQVHRQANGTKSSLLQEPQNFKVSQLLVEVKPPKPRSEFSNRIVRISISEGGDVTEESLKVSQSCVANSGAVNIVSCNSMNFSNNVITVNSIQDVDSSNVSCLERQETTVRPRKSKARPVIKVKKHAITSSLDAALEPGAPPTMVAMHSVLDTLEASILQISKSAQSDTESLSSDADEGEDDDSTVIRSCYEEVANKALEDLGIQISSIVPQPTSVGGSRWTCVVKDCDKSFPRLSGLKRHLLSHNGIRPYKCSYKKCGWAFGTWHKLKRHLETHLKRKDFVCDKPDCSRRFTTIYNLNTHKRHHLCPKKWPCSAEGCGKTFQIRKEWEEHMNGHQDVDAPYKCDIANCQKGFFSNNSLTSHRRCHRKEEERRCQWEGCGKLFDKPCRLKQHIRAHTGQKPFKCPFPDCSSEFATASKLSRHQRKHTDDRKFPCPKCGKLFMRSEHVKGHLLTHTGVRNFQCPLENCDSRFTAKSSLYVHLKKHRNPNVKEMKRKALVYRCPLEVCMERFSSKYSLKEHLLCHHSKDNCALDYITLLSDKDSMLETSSNSNSAVSETQSLLSGWELLGVDMSSGTHNSNGMHSFTLFGTGGIPGHLLASGDTLDFAVNDSLLGIPIGLDMVDLGREEVDLLTEGARTEQAVMQRGRKVFTKRAFEAGYHISPGMGNFDSDVVLSTSSVSLNNVSHLHTLFLQDEGISNDLYQDTLIDHELLSDSANDAQSTINLRDLE